NRRLRHFVSGTRAGDEFLDGRIVISQICDVDAAWILGQQLAALLGDSHVTTSRGFEQASLHEICTRPGDTVVNDRLLTARKQLRTLLVTEAEFVSNRLS